MSEFLTEQELIDLTGSQQRAKQIKALKKNHIHYFERFDGKPVVSRQAITLAIRGDLPGSTVAGKDGFNIEAISH